MPSASVLADLSQLQPDRQVPVKEAFPECAFTANFAVPTFSQASEFVPMRDPAYRLNADATLAVLAGFAFNRRVLLQGMHGTGKSTHIEQIAARLNWPCLRINLDGQISRTDWTGMAGIRGADGPSPSARSP